MIIIIDLIFNNYCLICEYMSYLKFWISNWSSCVVCAPGYPGRSLVCYGGDFKVGHFGDQKYLQIFQFPRTFHGLEGLNWLLIPSKIQMFIHSKWSSSNSGQNSRSSIQCWSWFVLSLSTMSTRGLYVLVKVLSVHRTYAFPCCIRCSTRIRTEDDENM